MGKYIKATADFKPGVSLPVPYSFPEDQKNGEKLFIIETPNHELIPYKPKIHNDSKQETGLVAGYKLLALTYNEYYKSTKDTRKVNASQIPTQKEIDIIYTSKIIGYLADGFDPDKGDSNNKWKTKCGRPGDPDKPGDPNKTGRTNLATKILVLNDRLYGGCYEAYIPSKHGSDASVTAITIKKFTQARLIARKKYEKLCANNRNSTPTTTPTPTPTSTTGTTTTTTTASHPKGEIFDVVVLPGLTSFLPVLAPEDTYKTFQPNILIRDYVITPNLQFENRHSQTNRGKEEVYTSDEEETDEDLSPPASPDSRKRKADELSDLPSVTETPSSFFHDSAEKRVNQTSNSGPSNPNSAIGRRRYWER